MPRNKIVKRKQQKKKRHVILIVSIVVALAAITVLCIFLLQSRMMKDPTIQAPDGKIEDQYNTPSTIKDKMANFLVLGVSNDPGLRHDDNMTDTIMVVSCDFEAKKINILQIPRDSYIGYETNTGKINAVYGQNPDQWDYAGLEGLVKIINETFGLTIDHYATVQMDGFARIVDSIGGVTMDVPKDMELDGLKLSAGKQTLTGEQAIAVVRVRKVYVNADLGRLDTQKLFMAALAKKCIKLNVAEMAGLITPVMESVTTDLNLSDVIEYYKLIQGMDLGSISVVSVPGEGLYTTKTNIGNQAVYSIDRQQTANLLNQFFRPYAESVPAENLNIIELTNSYSSPENQVSTFDELNGEQKPVSSTSGD